MFEADLEGWHGAEFPCLTPGRFIPAQIFSRVAAGRNLSQKIDTNH